MLNEVRRFFGMEDESDEPAPTPPEVLDLMWVMSDQRGRRHVWQQLAIAGIYRQSYTGESHGTDFNEGKRSVGLALLGRITAHCPDEYLLMLKEHQE